MDASLARKSHREDEEEEGLFDGGPWEYESVLGTGAFGVIFEVTEGLQIFAVKCISSTSLEDRQHYRNQCRLLSGIRHENVAEVLDYQEKFCSAEELHCFELPGTPLILPSRRDLYPLIKMEMCGKNLWTWMQNRNLYEYTGEMEWNIVQGLLAGLTFLHNNNILHRTLNPENLLFTYSETDPYALPIKIGHSALYCNALSMSSWDIERQGQYTELYVSPEAEAGMPSFSSDLFSLGLIFWQVIYALSSGQLSRLLYKFIYEKQYDLISDHPEILNAKELIIGMTQRYAKDRVKNISEIKFIRIVRDHKEIIKDEGNSTENIKLQQKNSGDLVPLVCSVGSNSDWLDKLGLADILGTGSYGCVLAAKTNETSYFSPTCVKIVFLDSPSLESSCESESGVVHRKARTTVYREYTTIAGKVHPNIVRVFNCTEKEYHPNDFLSLLKLEASENNNAFLFGMYSRVQLNLRRNQPIGTFCIQMERCGENLRTWLRNHTGTNVSQMTIEVQRTQVQIVRDLIEGLKYLHSNDIIHRDLKPDNILFSTSFSLPVKIGDFGLARFVSNSLNSSANDMTPNFCTTPFYRAPEMEGDDYGKPADLFSLGLVIWEVLQLISRKEFPRMKYNLVHDYDPIQHVDLIQPHPLVLNAKDIIYNLTRLIKARTQSIDDVVLETRQQK